MTARTKKRRRPHPLIPATERRTLLAWLLALPGLAIPFSVAAGRDREEINVAQTGLRQPKGTPSAFMAEAQRMKDLAHGIGDQGFVAVIVRDGLIVGRAPSRVIVDGDPTAHAEMEAIRDAAHNLGTRDLSGCVMYSTSRPCPMCEAAAYWANVKAMRFGPSIAEAGEPRLRRC